MGAHDLPREQRRRERASASNIRYEAPSSHSQTSNRTNTGCSSTACWTLAVCVGLCLGGVGMILWAAPSAPPHRRSAPPTASRCFWRAPLAAAPAVTKRWHLQPPVDQAWKSGQRPRGSGYSEAVQLQMLGDLGSRREVPSTSGSSLSRSPSSRVQAEVVVAAPPTPPPLPRCRRTWPSDGAPVLRRAVTRLTSPEARRRAVPSSGSRASSGSSSSVLGTYSRLLVPRQSSLSRLLSPPPSPSSFQVHLPPSPTATTAPSPTSALPCPRIAFASPPDAA